MREPYERIAGGPFRDDTHRAAVEATQTERAWLEANIAQCRQMLANCGDDDIITKMSFAGLIEKWKDRLDKVPAMPIAEPAETADGVSGADGKSTRVEAEDGRVRASQALGPYLTGATVTFQHPRGDKATVGVFEVMEAAQQVVGRIYDDLQTVMASAGSLPLASTDPWVEPIRDYGARLQRSFPGVDLSVLRDDVLECFGETEMIPRARLVPVTTKEGM